MEPELGLSVFGPSKNDLAIKNLQSEVAKLSGQMGLVAINHDAIRREQAKLSKAFDAFEVRTNAEKTRQDEYDEDIIDRLMRIEAVLWPYKRQPDRPDVEDQEPLLDRITRMEQILSTPAFENLPAQIQNYERKLANMVSREDMEAQMEQLDENYRRCMVAMQAESQLNDKNKEVLAALTARVGDIEHKMSNASFKTPILYTLPA
jgi:hypothetical protein